jgi:hypothetical protein
MMMLGAIAVQRRGAIDEIARSPVCLLGVSVAGRVFCGRHPGRDYQRRAVEMLAFGRSRAWPTDLQRRIGRPAGLWQAAAGYGVWVWMAAAFSAALVLAAGVLAIFGVNARAIAVALRVTARFSVLLFWPAYAGGALATLYGPGFGTVARRRREFGLAFASAHTVHLGLVIWLYRISSTPPVPNSSAVIFGIGFFWIFVLVLLSVRAVKENMAGRAWRTLQTIGIEYIAFLFFVDFLHPDGTGLCEAVCRKEPLVYVPFGALIVLGLALRITALVKGVFRRAALSRSNAKSIPSTTA